MFKTEIEEKSKTETVTEECYKNKRRNFELDRLSLYSARKNIFRGRNAFIKRVRVLDLRIFNSGVRRKIKELNEIGTTFASSVTSKNQRGFQNSDIT